MIARLCVTFVAVALLGMAGYREVMVAWSDALASRQTPASLDRASTASPQNAALWRERGILRLDSDPQSAGALLRQSIALNPFDAEARVALGLLAESAGRLAEAEDHLTGAARLSRRFRPQWALAYYYARHGMLDRFWTAARLAANIEAADIHPILRLARELRGGNPEGVADALQLRSQHALSSYVELLLKEPGPSELGNVAIRITPVVQARPLLLAAVDRLINENRSEQAVRIWNRLSGSTLAPEKGVSLSNTRFEAAVGSGFAWRYRSNPGVDIRVGAPGDLRIEFSGRQAESAVLLEQIAPVLPSRTYRFSFTYDSAGCQGPTGVYWQISPVSQEATFASPRLNPGASEGSLLFQTGSGVGLVRIMLLSARLPGSMRLQGVVRLRSSTLELL